MSTYLIINEQHSLFDEQREILRGYGKVKFINIPSAGLTRDEMDRFEIDHRLDTGDTVIFASPIPYLFHNDTRIKKELSDGRVINSVSTTGWQII